MVYTAITKRYSADDSETILPSTTNKTMLYKHCLFTTLYPLQVNSCVSSRLRGSKYNLDGTKKDMYQHRDKPLSSKLILPLEITPKCLPTQTTVWTGSEIITTTLITFAVVESQKV